MKTVRYRFARRAARALVALAVAGQPFLQAHPQVRIPGPGGKIASAAFTSHVASGTLSGTTTNASTWTANGTWSTLPNDVMVCGFGFNNTVSAITVADNGSPAASGTLVDSSGNNYMYAAVIASTGATTPSVAWTTNRTITGTCDLYRGGSQTVTASVIGEHRVDGATSNAPGSSVALTASAGYLVAPWCKFATAGTPVTPPSGYTIATSGTSQGAAYKLVGTASEQPIFGTVNSNAWTCITASFVP